jgi:hypothetical protein
MRVFVFLTRRPRDKEAWPLVYLNRRLAEQSEHRVSPVVEVEVDEFRVHHRALQVPVSLHATLKHKHGEER